MTAAVDIDVSLKLAQFEAQMKTMRGSLDKLNETAQKTGKSISEGFNNVEKNVDKADKAIGRSLATAVRSALAISAVYSALGQAKALIDTNRQFELLRVQLKNLDGEAAEQTFKRLTKAAAETPFEIGDLTEAYIRLKNFGLEPTEDVMAAMTNQTAKLGGSAARLESITTALGQAWAAGRLMGQEMLQLVNAGVPVYDILSKATGKNAEALRKMAAEGELSRDIISQFIVEMNKLSDGSNLAAMDTLEGKISNLSDAWHTFQDTLINPQMEKFMKDVLATLTADVQAVTDFLGGNTDKDLQNAFKELKHWQDAIKEAYRTGYDSNMSLYRQRETQWIAEIKHLQDVKKKEDEAAASAKKLLGDKAKAREEENKLLKGVSKLSKVENRQLDALLEGIRFVESNGGKNSPDRTSGNVRDAKGNRITASGDFQITNGTYENIIKAHPDLKGYDRMNPEQAKELARAMMEDLLKAFDGNEVKATLGYFVGEGAVKKAVSKYGEENYIDSIKVPGVNMSARGYLSKVQKGMKTLDSNSSLSGIAKQEDDKLEAADKERLKVLDERQKKLDAFRNTYAALQVDLTAGNLPEEERAQFEELNAVLEKHSLLKGNLTSEEQAQKAVLEDLIRTKYEKLAQDQIESQYEDIASENQEEYNDLMRDFDALVNDIVSRDDFAKMLQRLENDYKTGIISLDQYKAAIATLGTEFRKSQDVAERSADQISEFYANAAKSMQQNFANFLYDPFKDGLEGMVSGFASAIQRMIADAAAAQLMTALLGDSFTKTGSLGKGSLLNVGLDAVGSLFSGMSFFADGGVVVNKPTMFAPGMVAGEAGAEAIIPLKNGNVPVKLSGAKGDTFNVAINMQSSGDPAKDGQAAGEAFMRAIAKQEIASATRPGNTLNSNRRF